MTEKILIFGTIFLSLTIILCMVRVVKGPSSADRLLSINVIATKIIVLISIVSFILKETYFIDVVLVYALISYIASIVIADFIEKIGADEQ